MINNTTESFSYKATSQPIPLLPVWCWLKYNKQQQRIINIVVSLCLAGYSFTAGGPASSSCPIRILRTGRRSLSARTHVSSAVRGLEQVQIRWLRLKVDFKIVRLFFVLSGIVLIWVFIYSTPRTMVISSSLLLTSPKKNLTACPSAR